MLTHLSDPENVQRQKMAQKYGRTKQYHTDIDQVLGKSAAAGQNS